MMHCLKCGTEIESPNVFCESCLEEMAKNPVSRETPLVIHPRPEPDPERRNRRPIKPQKPEEVIAQLRRRQRRLSWLCVALATVCAALVLLYIFVPLRRQDRPAIGQNYVTNITEPILTTGEPTS